MINLTLFLLKISYVVLKKKFILSSSSENVPVHNAVCRANWLKQLHFNADVGLLRTRIDCQSLWAGAVCFTFPETLFSSCYTASEFFKPASFLFKPFTKIHLLGSCRSCSLSRDTLTSELHRFVTAKQSINKMEPHPANQGT